MISARVVLIVTASIAGTAEGVGRHTAPGSPGTCAGDGKGRPDQTPGKVPRGTRGFESLRPTKGGEPPWRTCTARTMRSATG